MSITNEESLRAARLADSPLHRFMGLEFLPFDREAGFVEVRLPFSEALRRQDGEELLHGGVIATLIDVTGVWAIAAGGGPPGPTVDMRVDFLRTARCEAHVARGRLIRIGRNFAVIDVRVENDEGRVVAVGRSLFSVAPEHTATPQGDPT